MVTVEVVHVLESVQVDEDDGRFGMRPRRDSSTVGEAFLQQLPIRETGERVVERTVVERL